MAVNVLTVNCQANYELQW